MVEGPEGGPSQALVGSDRFPAFYHQKMEFRSTKMHTLTGRNVYRAPIATRPAPGRHRWQRQADCMMHAARTGTHRRAPKFYSGTRGHAVGTPTGGRVSEMCCAKKFSNTSVGPDFWHVGGDKGCGCCRASRVGDALGAPVRIKRVQGNIAAGEAPQVSRARVALWHRVISRPRCKHRVCGGAVCVAHTCCARPTRLLHAQACTPDAKMGFGGRERV